MLSHSKEVEGQASGGFSSGLLMQVRWLAVLIIMPWGQPQCLSMLAMWNRPMERRTGKQKWEQSPLR